MHIKNNVNNIFRISMLLLRVSVLYERHLQGTQRILIKLCICYVISAELSEGNSALITQHTHNFIRILWAP
jgi:hypothetical protein